MAFLGAAIDLGWGTRRTTRIPGWQDGQAEREAGWKDGWAGDADASV